MPSPTDSNPTGEARPRDHRDVVREMEEHLRDTSGAFLNFRGDAYTWLKDPKYDSLKLRLELAYAAGEAAAA